MKTHRSRADIRRLPFGPIRPVLCPSCGKNALRQRLYKDGSSLFVHREWLQEGLRHRDGCFQRAPAAGAKEKA